MSLGPKTGKGSSLNGEHSIADYTGNMKTLLFALCALVPLLCHPVHGGKCHFKSAYLMFPLFSSLYPPLRPSAQVSSH